MNTSNNTRIVGLSGMFASGKDTLANYLADTYGYQHISTGDMLREEAMRRYGSIERPILHRTGTELRQEEGAGALVKHAIALFQAELDAGKSYPGVVISGLRSLGEAKAIKEAGGTLVFTDAPIELRYQRMQSRLRDKETHLTFEEFQTQEATEASTVGGDDASFNMLGIRDLAGENVVSNETDLESFLARARQVLHLENK